MPVRRGPAMHGTVVTGEAWVDRVEARRGHRVRSWGFGTARGAGNIGDVTGIPRERNAQNFATLSWQQSRNNLAAGQYFGRPIARWRESSSWRRP